MSENSSLIFQGRFSNSLKSRFFVNICTSWLAVQALTLTLAGETWFVNHTVPERLLSAAAVCLLCPLDRVDREGEGARGKRSTCTADSSSCHTRPPGHRPGSSCGREPPHFDQGRARCHVRACARPSPVCSPRRNQPFHVPRDGFHVSARWQSPARCYSHVCACCSSGTAPAPPSTFALARCRSR